MAKSRQDRCEDDDIKSGPSSMKEHERNDDVEDYEVHTKQDAPPRFSTIFDTKPVPGPVPVERYIEAPPRRERRGGVFVTWPIVVLLVIIFLFETIIIFAYTSIGLYNQLSGFTGRSQTFVSHAGTSACDLAPQNQAAAPINISPNIIIGAVDHPAAITQTVTLPGLLPFPMQLSASITTSRSLSSSSSTSSTSPSTASSSSTTSIPVVTVTPGGIATSVVFVTAGVESKTDIAAPTTFVTVIAGQSTVSSSSSSSSTTTAAEATKNIVTPSSSSTTSTSTSTTSSTSTTATTPPSSSSSTTTSTTATTEAHGTNAAFIGGLGGTGGH